MKPITYYKMQKQNVHSMSIKLVLVILPCPPPLKLRKEAGWSRSYLDCINLL